MYGKVRSVFKQSASDYEKDSPAAKSFFAIAQDKFHFAITGQTAAEIILERADASLNNMGLTTMKGELPTQEDVITGKNYLTADELRGWRIYANNFYCSRNRKPLGGTRWRWKNWLPS